MPPRLRASVGGLKPVVRSPKCTPQNVRHDLLYYLLSSEVSREQRRP